MPTTSRRGRAAVAAALAALAVAACSAGPPPPDPAAPTGANAVVVRVIDGDTVEVRIGDADEHARLIGIDTPETKKPGTPVECFGPEASDRLHALLPEGTPIRLELDEEPRDRYGRLLVYVQRSADDVFVNEVLVREGYADTLSIEPNTARAGLLADARDVAQANRAGLWGACPDGHSPAGADGG